MTARDIAQAHAMRVRAEWLCIAKGWTPSQIDTFHGRPADWIVEAIADLVELLVEVDDLLPRISDDDPMAPALEDWLHRVRTTLAAGEGTP